MDGRALLCLLALLLAKGWADEILSMKDLENVMTTKLTESRGCVRRLTAHREVGCGVSGDGTLSAPIVHMTSIDYSLIEDRTVLVPLDLVPRLLDGVLHNDNLKQHVKGVLIAETGQTPNNFSTGALFPSSGFPQPSSDAYIWNPWGTGLRLQRFEIPIFLLTRELTENAIDRAERNARQGFTGAVHVAKMSAKMEGEHNSSHCIKQKHCLPIGGHSVLAALPDSEPTAQEKPIVLAIAQMDTAALFADRAVGADSRLSSLLVLLTAVDLLHKAGPLEGAPNRLMAAAMSGEVWDYMGSRRMLWELGNGSSFANNSVPVDLKKISQVVELGSLGAPGNVGGTPRIFLHRSNASSPSSSPINAAFVASAAEMIGQHKIIVENATGTPGLPPSSLKSFLLEVPAIDGVFVAEFNTKYTNRFFESHLDNDSNIDPAAIAAASVLMARTLYRLAYGGSPPRPLEVDDAEATNATNALVDCLAKPDPSLRCPLAAGLLSLRAQDATSTGQAEHYLGTLPTLSVDPQEQDPSAKSNLERFVYNYLALRTALGGPGAPCNNKGRRCAAGEGLVCAGYRFGVKGEAGLGRCVRSEVFFVPSYSLLLSCPNCSAAEYAAEDKKTNRWVLTSGAEKEALEAWMVTRNLAADPMWTESDWPPENPRLEMFLKEERSTEVQVLVAGLVLTMGAAVAAVAAQVAIDKHWKRS
ncbi:unnamed protein product [Ostreobium quekettii]|uniref:Nicastrin n=1 Tax=Ostreobium quekettii TaxID=121088 RepID=A0A8S1J144_9CHLO|nr:unnamed protein product [Ostreobium quekettii]|eukprot:evm.model.scf_104.7 EVM.evm.TU.scf_104.7   scf_104:88311-98554(+)